MKTALITGVTGQDGAYLAEFLLKKGYIVHGIKRRASSLNTDRVDHLYQDPQIENRNFVLHYGDLTDSLNITRIIQQVQPDEIYNLGAQSHVQVSFETPEYTANVDALGTLRVLEAVRLLGLTEKTKIYQASTSELYGGQGKEEELLSETTPFNPRSPYACAKLYAFAIVKNYREAYGMFACNGILFNHESPLRGETFVTRKITRATAKIALGGQDCLYLGNLSAKRDWGHAKDYIAAQWLILQQSKPEDFVIATGATTTVRDFVRLAFAYIGVSIRFTGTGVAEQGVVEGVDGTVFAAKVGAVCSLKVGQVVVKVDEKYFRPTEVDILIGDPSKAKRELGWEPQYNLQGLVDDMMQSDIKLMKKEDYLVKGGYQTHNYFE